MLLHRYTQAEFDALPTNDYENKVDLKVTNSDRIRGMSDKELASFLALKTGWDCHLCAEHGLLDNEPLLRGERCDENCIEHCLEWLKQPAEG